MARNIPLPNGRFAIVDDEDYERLMLHKWFCSGGYAARKIRKGLKITEEKMHRVIVDALDGVEVDHVNGDKLDNRRGNLRVCTHEQNMANRRKHRNNTSGYTGVVWLKDQRCWRAEIKVGGRKRYLGRFDNAEDAAKAYDAAALQLKGEFARINNVG